MKASPFYYRNSGLAVFFLRCMGSYLFGARGACVTVFFFRCLDCVTLMVSLRAGSFFFSDVLTPPAPEVVGSRFEVSSDSVLGGLTIPDLALVGLRWLVNSDPVAVDGKLPLRSRRCPLGSVGSIISAISAIRMSVSQDSVGGDSSFSDFALVGMHLLVIPDTVGGDVTFPVTLSVADILFLVAMNAVGGDATIP